MYTTQYENTANINEDTYIYKLNLENGKKYIGKTVDMDRRMDQAESGVSVHEQRVQVLSSMLSPETQERRHKEIANLQARIGANEKDLLQLKLLHNSEHPYIPKPTLP